MLHICGNGNEEKVVPGNQGRLNQKYDLVCLKISGEIYFATNGTGLMALIPRTSKVIPIRRQNESLVAVAYDAKRKKLYSADFFKIYGCDTNWEGNAVEKVFSTSPRCM